MRDCLSQSANLPQRNTWYLVSQSSQSITSHLQLSAKKRSPSHFSMQRKSDTVKAVNRRKARSKAKVIEWETQVHSRGTRDVPVEVSVVASQRKPREKTGRRPRAENNDPLQGQQGEAAPQPMDVDETWVEEPVMHTSEKRVRQPSCPSLTNLTHILHPAHLH
jgi:hypothetical protein